MDYAGHQATSDPSANLFFADLDVSQGTSGPDTMTGSNGPETLLGLDGNDILIGNDGSDHLDGGAGRDSLQGGNGNDHLYGGDDIDEINGGAGNDQLFGGAGDDLLSPGPGFNDVDGGAGIDRLSLNYAASAQSLYFQYHPGTNIALPDGGSDSVINVEAMVVQGTNYADVIIGTDYGDQLFGGNGFDLLQGGAGDDLLDGGTNSGSSISVLPTAADTLAAALPIDHFLTLNDDTNVFNSTSVPHATLNVYVQTGQFESFQETSRFVAINVAQAGQTLTLDVDGTWPEVDTRVAIYDSSGTLIAANDDGDYFSLGGFDPGTASSSDSLLSFDFLAAGTYYVEIIADVSAADHSSSFAVNFSLTGAAAPTGDMLQGGAGNDTYVVRSASDQVTEQLGEGTDTVRANLSYTLGDNVENLVLTGAAALAGTGNALANTITGNAAVNVLSGLAGNDVLDGGAGGDSMIGGRGNDIYLIDNAGDHVTEDAASGADTIKSTVSHGLEANVENLLLLGTGAINGTGNALANVITGNAAANVLNGLAGADTLKGGAGNDIYVVDNAGDKVIELATGGIDTVRASISFSAVGLYIENVTLTGAGAINATGNGAANNLIGNNAANTLSGNAGADILSGGGGADQLAGGTGNDTLTGGTGHDNFLFNSALNAVSNVDHIVDFTAVDDTIVLDQTIFAAVATGTLAASAFFSGTAAHDADDRIIYDSATGKIYYDADGNGAGAKLLFAQVTAGSLLTNADFSVVSSAPIAVAAATRPAGETAAAGPWNDPASLLADGLRPFPLIGERDAHSSADHLFV
jgi:Ca2+-binding RTX toxin-like protein